MDLFTHVVPPEALHPNFRRLADKHSGADRAVLSQWADGFKDRDGKFVREFQATFNSGFWELYIFACCKELGFGHFNHHDITQATLLRGNPVPRYKCKHGHLIQRSSITLRPTT
jgi:hypothetical protein